MLPRGRAGISLTGYAGFAPPSEVATGNNNPPWTGSHTGPPDMPGPHPATQPLGGQTGDTDGFGGADPKRPKLSPRPRSTDVGAWGEGDPGNAPGPAGPPLPYGGGASNVAPDNLSPNSYAARLGSSLGGDPLPAVRPSWWRGGIQGFNDQLQIRDRHAYFEAGRQRHSGDPYPGTQMSGRNPQLDGPPMATLKAVNISVNPQMNSDHTAFADDLTRPYTWLGQQDGTRQAIYGGVPGLWQSYGNRGFSAGIHDPSNGEGGRSMVSSGPPHGLHSNGIPDGKQLIDRYKSVPQMRPVRLDRPSNSTTAGQSFSQTVQFQGDTGPAQAARSGQNIGVNFGISGGWRGRTS